MKNLRYRIRRFSRRPRTYVIQSRIVGRTPWRIVGDGSEPVIYGSRDEARAVMPKLRA